MTDNRQVSEAWEYHNGTKHSYRSVRLSTHSLDFSNYPLLFKIYETLEPIPLPRTASSLSLPALEAIARTGSTSAGERLPTLETLAQLLHLSAGITRERKTDDWEVQFRAAACIGALYHIELYLICGDLPGLPAGVYHFGVHDFSLRRLRAGDYRGALVRATGSEPTVATAPVVIACTGTYFRNAWKYQARTYRHCFWDTGTTLANLLAAAAAQDLQARVVLGFVDREPNGLLDLDIEREVTLALVPLGRTQAPPPAAIPAIAPLRLETAPISRYETDYPAIRAMHAASSLASEEEAETWRGEAASGDPPAGAGRRAVLRPLSGADAPAGSVTEVIMRRGSTRRFSRQPLTLAQLSTLLERATRGVPADFLEPPGATINTLYLIVNAVEDLADGTYVYHREARELELLQEGRFRNEAGHLGLDQELPADASVNVYFLSDLERILARFGNRGYRAAQLEAAIMGGKLYLGAYAQRFGATGLTFYDDHVTEFFAPHAAGKSVMFLTAFGHPARRRTVARG